MGKETVLLQHDMFTGKLVDTRTRTQKKVDRERNDWQQLEMFRQRDLAQFGVSAYPVMDVSPGRLVLISEDPRTVEEKEADLRREAQERTRKMFDKRPDLYSSQEIEVGEQVQAVEETLDTKPVSNKIDNLKLVAYLELVQVVREQVATLWVAEAYRQRFLSQLPLAVLNAAAAGLTAAEIAAGLQVAHCLGEQKVLSSEAVSVNGGVSSKSNTPERIIIPVHMDEKPKTGLHEASKGFRKLARKQKIGLRTR